MANLNMFEKTVIIIVSVTGLVGGVFLVYFQFPPIVPSIFFGLAIATLVYHFLGGIDDATFNAGPVKLGGSIAALVGTAWLISMQLTDQQTNPERSLMLGKDYTVWTEDSVALGKFTLDKIALSDDLLVLTNDSLVLGTIEVNNLKGLNFFNGLKLDTYIELNYDMSLNPRFNAALNFRGFEKFESDFRNAYADLPFQVSPAFTTVNNRQLHTLVSYKANRAADTLSISSGWLKIIEGLDDKVYLVRLRASNTSDGTKPYFANYQILEISRTIEP